MLKIYIINMAKIQIIKVAKQISISGGSNSAHSANSNDKNTKEYFAKIWLTHEMTQMTYFTKGPYIMNL